MFWKRAKKRKPSPAGNFSKEIKCCESFERAIAAAKQAVEDAEEPSITDLHQAWQREQMGLPVLSDDTRHMAQMFKLPLTTDRHIRARFRLKNLWHQREQYRRVEPREISGRLEHKPDGPHYFDHGDTPFIACQIRKKDGSVRHVAIEQWHHQWIGRVVRGKLSDGFFCFPMRMKKDPRTGVSNPVVDL